MFYAHGRNESNKKLLVWHCNVDSLEAYYLSLSLPLLAVYSKAIQ